MKLTLCLLLAGMVGNVSVAFAADNEAAPVAKVDTRYPDAVKAAKSGDYKTAIGTLEKLAVDRPSDADVQNMLGFSYRKSGDKTRGMTHYNKALSINPAHAGALEYQGELFLELKNIKDAEANLAKIEKACGGKSCAEYKTLAGSIETFKTKGTTSY